MDAELDGSASLLSTLEEMEDDWGTKHVVYIVGSGVEHAPYMEFGTAPHLITPNDAEALRFVVNGTVVYAKSVNHPGTDPQPYLRPALEATERHLDAIAADSDSLEEFMQRAALYCEGEAKKRAPTDTGMLRASIKSERVE